MTPTELYDIRTGRAHSQRQLAAVLGVAGNTVARWERGERPIPRWVDQSLAVWQQLAVCKNELEQAQITGARLRRRLQRVLATRIQ
jgi:DNA-binding XRE family transcriptional regulator